MVGTLVRLKLTLWRRGVRGRKGRVFAVVALALVALWVFGMLGFAMLAVRHQPGVQRGALLVIALAVVTLCWPLLTLLYVGADQTLDPGRFALFPVSARQLLPGLLVCGLLSTGGVFTVAVALVHAVDWADSMPTLLAALASLVLGVLTCILLSRVAASLFAAAMARRRSRDVTAMLVAGFGILANLGMQLMMRTLQQVTGPTFGQRLQGAARVAGWTPFGWAWALPWDVARAQPATLAAHAVLAVLLVVGLWLAWRRSLDRALCSPLESGGDGGHVKASSPIDRLVPGTPAGAVAARSLRYWRRDPRHLVQLGAVLLLPVMMVLPRVLWHSDEQGTPDTGLFAAVFLPLVMGAMIVAQEISTDGSALWMHISSGIRGVDDRWGRLIAALWVLVPVISVVDLALVAVEHRWERAPLVLGLSLGVLLVGSGVGSLTGAHWQIPQPPPGSSPFGRTSGGGAASLALSFANILGGAVLSIPIFLAYAFAGHSALMGWLLLVLGPAYGALVAWGGVRAGGRALEERWPEVLRSVTYEAS